MNRRAPRISIVVPAAVVVILGAAAILACDGFVPLRDSMRWLAEVNRHEGSLVRAYGQEGNDEFVAIVEPPEAVLSEPGYLAIGDSDSWGQRESGLWILAVNSAGVSLCSFYFDGSGGVDIVAAGRSHTDASAPDTLAALGNSLASEGNLALALMPLDSMRALYPDDVALDIDVFLIDAAVELTAAGMIYEQNHNLVIVGSSDGHPMIMSLDLAGGTPVIDWAHVADGISGTFTAATCATAGGVVVSGTASEAGDLDVLLAAFDDAGTPAWSLTLGDDSADEQGGAVLFTSASGEDRVVAGCSSEDYTDGWLFHEVTPAGQLRATSWVSLAIPDLNPDPPRAAAESWLGFADSTIVFSGTEATALTMEDALNPIYAARRDAEPDNSAFEYDFLNAVAINGTWHGNVHAGSMASLEFLPDAKRDGMILWPLPEDGASYPANRCTCPAAYDLSPETPPVKDTLVTTDIAAGVAVSEVTGWTLTSDQWDQYEY